MKATPTQQEVSECGEDIFWFRAFTNVVILVVFTKPPYEVSETGWGEFEVVIKVFFLDSSEKPVSLVIFDKLDYFLFAFIEKLK